MTLAARVLVADAPWTFGDKLPGKKRGAEKHYKCMSLSEIIRMPLPPIHDDAVLFFWRVSSMVEEAYQVIRAWDFVPKSELVWNKTDATGEKDSIGMGRIVRGSHETCIVATRGKLIEPSNKGIRTSFRAPRTEHSEKPEEFYQIVERLYPLELWPEAHVELFARRRRKGWIQFGDELPAESVEQQPMCLLHGEPSATCKQCSIVATSVRLKSLLARTNGWRGAGWRDVRHIVARDAIEDSAATEPAGGSDENGISVLAAALIRRGFAIRSADLTAMTALQQSVVRAYIDQDGDPPTILVPFARSGATPP